MLIYAFLAIYGRVFLVTASRWSCTKTDLYCLLLKLSVFAEHEPSFSAYKQEKE